MKKHALGTFSIVGFYSVSPLSAAMTTLWS